jgi:glycosyltransferase involved in cell wall biosynthesis
VSRLEEPRFSVVIPCYNEANFISATLQSLTNQKTIEKYEIIVVDNNCTDETVKIAKSFGAKIITEKMRGVCWARQAGTERASGEIIISTDADTIFSPEWLSNIDNEFRQDDQVVAVSGLCRFYDAPWWEPIYTNFLLYSVHFYNIVVGRPCYISAANTAFKKSAWQRYDVTMTQGADELDLLRQLRKSGKVQFIKSNTVYTSARRLKKGLLYNLLVSLLFYYFGAYYINKVFKKPVIGTAPAFREDLSARSINPLNGVLAMCAMSALVSITMLVPYLRNILLGTAYGLGDITLDALRFVIR